MCSRSFRSSFDQVSFRPLIEFIPWVISNSKEIVQDKILQIERSIHGELDLQTKEKEFGGKLEIHYREVKIEILRCREGNQIQDREWDLDRQKSDLE